MLLNNGIVLFKAWLLRNIVGNKIASESSPDQGIMEGQPMAGLLANSNVFLWLLEWLTPGKSGRLTCFLRLRLYEAEVGHLIEGLCYFGTYSIVILSMVVGFMRSLFHYPSMMLFS